MLAGGAFLFIGGRHFGNGWPGTGGHGSFVPAGVAGYDDPFYPGVLAFARALPATPGGVPPELAFRGGCHTGAFFSAEQPPSLAFLARHLSGPGLA